MISIGTVGISIIVLFIKSNERGQKMQAIILAAGMGKRLKELTKDNTKCMIKVNGVTLIERMLRQIDRKHLSRVVIVVGYKGQELIEYIDSLAIATPIIYVNNDVYDKTNNIYSLALAKEFLRKEDTLLFESDLIFEDAVLDELLQDTCDTLALVDKYESWMDGTCMKISEDGTIEAFVSGRKFRFEESKDYYKTVNIYKFSRNFCESYYIPFLEAYSKAMGNNEYYEQVLRVITMLDEPVIKAKKLNGQLWYEIDDIQDLDIASSLFMEDEEKKITLIQERYGGYWRYPHMLDFCYLVNPYYPNQKLINEIKSSFDVVLTQYPSGMKVNSLLAAKNFAVHQENIVVGNGAAELIKVLMERMEGNTGFIRPSFEEYSNRYDRKKSIFFTPENQDYSYTISDIMKYFEDKMLDNLIVINPDNPSGNYVSKGEMLRLLDWSRERQIHLVVDESFADFATEENNTLIHQNILDKYSNLTIIKSISKSYGVPGLRLGIAVSGNCSLIEEMKREVAIWNINSFAEFYMQIEGKYRTEYLFSLEKIRKERARLKRELSKIEGVRVIPSEANYFMIELMNGMTSRELTKCLLIKYSLFVKDLSKKIKKGEYIRVAVRDTADNDKLIAALKKEI